MGQQLIARDTQDFIDAVGKTWRKSVELILKTCNLMSQAKKKLTPEQFKILIDELAFSKRTADRLVAIGDDKRLKTHVSQLPPAWGTMYEITRLDDKTLNDAIEQEIITPTVQRSKISSLHKSENNDSTTESNPTKHMIKVCMIYADSEDDAFEVLKHLQKYDNKKQIRVDSDRFARKLEREQLKLHNNATIRANRRAYKIIREADTKIRKQCRKPDGRFDRRSYQTVYGEFSDFFEYGLKDYEKVHCTNKVDSPLNFMLNEINCEFTTQDFYDEELG